MFARSYPPREFSAQPPLNRLQNGDPFTQRLTAFGQDRLRRPSNLAHHPLQRVARPPRMCHREPMSDDQFSGDVWWHAVPEISGVVYDPRPRRPGSHTPQPLFRRKIRRADFHRRQADELAHVVFEDENISIPVLKVYLALPNKRKSGYITSPNSRP